MQAAEQRIQDQLRLATALTKLRTDLEAGSGSEEVKMSVVRILNDLVPLHDEDDAVEPPVGLELTDRARPRPVVVS